jgi:hypothetical protein
MAIKIQLSSTKLKIDSKTRVRQFPLGFQFDVLLVSIPLGNIANDKIFFLNKKGIVELLSFI